ncbi:hypothetical protein A2U01_0011207 [Trifolium medium]|uniref:Uncharacterized protein n=1 Tax=Trifolium medium TaxID=97028 RepID=A0A392MVH1_9FABA|nr:hypothetical protein [Trifolium medium]
MLNQLAEPWANIDGDNYENPNSSASHVNAIEVIKEGQLRVRGNKGKNKNGKSMIEEIAWNQTGTKEVTSGLCEDQLPLDNSMERKYDSDELGMEIVPETIPSDQQDIEGSAMILH